MKSKISRKSLLTIILLSLLVLVLRLATCGVERLETASLISAYEKPLPEAIHFVMRETCHCLLLSIKHQKIEVRLLAESPELADEFMSKAKEGDEIVVRVIRYHWFRNHLVSFEAHVSDNDLIMMRD